MKAEDVIMSSIAWNKLYQRDLFNNTRYPEGHVYEDIATTHKMIYRADRILKIQHYLYYHRYRQGSITKSAIGIDDLLRMSKQRYNELIEYGYQRDKAYSQLIESALLYCGKAQNEDNSLYQEAVKIVKEGLTVRLSGKAKLKRDLFLFNRSFYRFIYKSVILAKSVLWG